MVHNKYNMLHVGGNFQEIINKFVLGETFLKQINKSFALWFDGFEMYSTKLRKLDVPRWNAEITFGKRAVVPYNLIQKLW